MVARDENLVWKKRQIFRFLVTGILSFLILLLQVQGATAQTWKPIDLGLVKQHRQMKPGFTPAFQVNSIDFHPNHRFIYASNYAGGNILGFKMNSKGKLNPLPGSPYDQGGFSYGTAVDPKGQFMVGVYARTRYSVRLYRINKKSGALKRLGLYPKKTKCNSFINGDIPAQWHPNGKWLYVSCNSSGAMLILFHLDRKRQRLKEIKQYKFKGTISSFQLGGNGKILIKRSYDDVKLFSVDSASGKLTQSKAEHNFVDAHHKKIEIQKFVLSPIDPWLIGEGGYSGKIRGFKWDRASGTFISSTPENMIPMRNELSAGSSFRVFHPDGKRIYYRPVFEGKLQTYQFDSKSGVLTHRQELSIPAGLPRKIKIHPTGKWLFNFGGEPGAITVMRIKANTGDILPTGRYPRNLSQGDLVVSKNGHHLFQANGDQNSVTAFSRKSDGKLTPLGRLHFPSAPSTIWGQRHLAIHPKGRWLVTGQKIYVNTEKTEKNALHLIFVDGKTGKMTPGPTVTLPEKINPNLSFSISIFRNIFFHPSGKSIVVLASGGLLALSTDSKTSVHLVLLFDFDEKTGKTTFNEFGVFDKKFLDLKMKFTVRDDPHLLGGSPPGSRRWARVLLGSDGKKVIAVETLKSHKSKFIDFELNSEKGLIYTSDSKVKKDQKSEYLGGFLKVYRYHSKTGEKTPVDMKNLFSPRTRFTGLVMHPNGKHLYGLSSFERAIHILPLHAKTGFPQKSPQNPVPISEDFPKDLIFSQDGTTAYVLHALNGFSVFRVHPKTGALTLLETWPADIQGDSLEKKAS